MDYKRNQQIFEQVEKWDVYARLTPTIFLLTSILLILFDVIDFETAFYVGVGGFAITAVVWWWWTIITIKYLVVTLNRASKNLQEVNQEVKEITQEVKEITQEVKSIKNEY